MPSELLGISFHAGRMVRKMGARQLHVYDDADHPAQDQRQVSNLLMQAPTTSSTSAAFAES